MGLGLEIELTWIGLGLGLGVRDRVRDRVDPDAERSPLRCQGRRQAFDGELGGDVRPHTGQAHLVMGIGLGMGLGLGIWLGLRWS